MIRCIRFRAFEKNTLKGFAGLELTRVGLIIRDCTLHEKNRKEWVGFPARSYEAKTGETAWQPLVELIIMARLTPSSHITRARERDLADLIKDLEVALNYSRGFYVRPPIEAAIEFLWALRCELLEE
jgi:hypothetical protein